MYRAGSARKYVAGAKQSTYMTDHRTTKCWQKVSSEVCQVFRIDCVSQKQSSGAGKTDAAYPINEEIATIEDWKEAYHFHSAEPCTQFDLEWYCMYHEQKTENSDDGNDADEEYIDNSPLDDMNQFNQVSEIITRYRKGMTDAVPDGEDNEEVCSTAVSIDSRNGYYNR